MTHAYRQPIGVTLDGDKLATFRWRNLTYRVVEIYASWRLIDRWWEPPSAPGDGKGASDRTYYRLRGVSGHEDLTCEIYFEAVGAAWILERVYD